MSTRVFIFAGGGTGGHIFPAIAISEQVHDRLGALARSLFVCSDRPLDAQILAAEKVDFRPIPAQPFGVHPVRLVRFAASWPKTVNTCRTLIRELRVQGSQVHIVALGGFVAAPVAHAARKEQVPITLVNLDAAPGKANRFIARSASRIFTAADPGEGRENWERIRPIVRKAAIGCNGELNAAQCRHELGLSPQNPVLFVTGASQGASSINHFLVEFVKHHGEALRAGRWQIVHQTGKPRADSPGEIELLRHKYTAAGVVNIVEPFFQKMGLLWGAADCAVSRAGAGSVAEAWGNRVPTLFLPYPYHKDQHQKLNAKTLVDAGACLLADDHISAPANYATSGPLLLKLLTDAPARATMKTRLVALGPTDGASIIADWLCA